MNDVKQIKKVLKAYCSSQVDVLQEMAALRGKDPEKLTPADYRALLEEEAEFSIQATFLDDPEEVEEALIYSADLLAMAAAIPMAT